VTTTITQLGQVATQSAKGILADIQSVYNNALGQTGSEAFCTADFIGRRLQQRLQAVAHKFDQSKPDAAIVPVVCITDPNVQIKAKTDRVITYYGYDFQAFERTSSFIADLQYASGAIVKHGFGGVAVKNNYQLTISFQAADYSNVDPAQQPQLVLKWDGKQVEREDNQAAIPVIFPQTRVEEFTVRHYVASEMFEKCENFSIDHQIQGGWTIDRSKGDPVHPGINEIEVGGNNQANTTLRGYNYQSINDSTVRVEGRICAGAFKGPGAIFERDYRVYIERD